MKITRENPFVPDSHRHRAFEFLKDGKSHSLTSITNATWGAYYASWYGNNSYRKRETASVLRHIRRSGNRLGIFYNPAKKTYRMEDFQIKTEAAAGSHPADDRSSEG